MLSEERLAYIRETWGEGAGIDWELVKATSVVRELLADRDALATEVERLKHGEINPAGWGAVGDVSVIARQLFAKVKLLHAEVERLKPLAAIGEAMMNTDDLESMSLQLLADTVPAHRWHYSVDRAQSLENGWAETLTIALREMQLMGKEATK